MVPSMSARITPPSVLKKSVVYVSNVPVGHVNANVSSKSGSRGKQFFGSDALRADNQKKVEEVAIERSATSKIFKGFVVMYFLRKTPRLL